MANQQDTQLSHASRRRYWREADARLVVDAWRQSGLLMAEFAKLHGVQAKRLSRWAQRLQTSLPPVTFHPVQPVTKHGVTGRLQCYAGGARRSGRPPPG
jgi:hypothetical protein